MVRITLHGDDLGGFVSASFDDHIKLFFPADGINGGDLLTLGPNGLLFRDGAPRPPSRDFTPRRYDAGARELDIDFAIHAAGPAAAWAASAKPGQSLLIGGPRGSFVIPDDFDWYLLAGDETALPAIGRRLDELPPGARAIVVAEVADAAEEQRFAPRAGLDVTWLHREGVAAGASDLLPRAIGELDLPGGDGYCWIAAESDTARAVRRRLVDERGLRKEWIRAAGYWKRGAVALHEMLDD